MYLPKFKLREKLIFFFVLLPVIPLLIINIIWFNASRKNIIDAVSLEVQNSASHASDEVNNYFATKVLSLIIHSQTEAVLQHNIPDAIQEFRSFLLQDEDIQTLSLLDKNGMELLKMDRSRVYSAKELTNQKDSNAYKVTTFVGGDRYIGPVRTDKSGKPLLTIAIPIVKSQNAQNLQSLSTSAVGNYMQPGEVYGILIETISPSNLWQSLSAIKIGSNGYIFVVDDKGTVLTHPFRSSLVGQNLKGIAEVDAFLTALDAQQPTISTSVRQLQSENSTPSLMSYRVEQLTNWGIIAEAPLSETLAATDNVAWFAVVLFVATLIGIFSLSVWLANRIIKPVKELAEGSHIIGGGDFEYRFNIKTGDELEELGNAFNLMALNLRDVFRALKMGHVTISAERNKLAIALATIADGLLAVDSRRTIVLFNKAAEQMTGYTTQEVLGKPLDQVFRIFYKDQEILPSIYCPVISTNGALQTYKKEDVHLLTHGNRDVSVNIAATQVRNGEGTNVACLLTIHDIREEKQLEHMKLDFVSMAAHELRTPLTSIKGYLSVLSNEIKSKLTDEQNMFLGRVQASAEQLLALVEDILNVSGIERNKSQLHFEPTDLKSVAVQVIEELTAQASAKSITLTLVPPEREIQSVSADRLRVREVFINLISNAITYSNPGGKIAISFEANTDGATVHITDTGIGIPKEALSHLFTKFFRVKDGLLQSTKGTGLGLYIIKSIIEQHQGRVFVESTVGKGSTFSFFIPFVHVDPKQTITTRVDAPAS